MVVIHWPMKGISSYLSVGTFCILRFILLCHHTYICCVQGFDWILHFLDKLCFSEEVVRAIEAAQARCALLCRWQHEVVSPALFEAARSGDFSLVTRLAVCACAHLHVCVDNV